MGKTPTRSDLSYWQNGSYDWISISDLNTDRKYISDTKERITTKAVRESGIKKIPANTVIMSFKLSIGKTAITSHDMFSNEAIMAFIDRKVIRINPDYIYYLLHALDWNKRANKAVKGRTVNKKIISQTQVNIPDYQTQLRIVKIMDSTRKRVKIQKDILSKLDTLIKARFVEMFGDPMIKKDDRNLRKLKEICIINPKKNLASKFSNDIEVSFVPMSSVSEQGDIDVSQRKNYSEVRKGFTYFAENDVLFAKITPCMENGKGAIATGLINGIGFGSTEFHILRPIKNITNPYWIYVLTSFKSFRKLAEVNMTGSAGQRRVPATFLKDYEVRLPPIELQNEFASFVQQVDKSKVVNASIMKYIISIRFYLYFKENKEGAR